MKKKKTQFKIPKKVSDLGKPSLQIYDPMKQGISQSMINNFLSCEQKFIYAINKIRPEGNFGGAMLFGSLIHFVLSEIEIESDTIENFNYEKSIEKFYANLEKTTIIDEQEKEKHIGMALGLLPVYVDIYKSKIKSRKFHSIEKTVSVQGKYFIHRGKLDGLFSPQKSQWLLEHKTMGRIDEDKIMYSLMMDFQVQYYDFLVDKDLGIDLQGCLFDVLRSPQLRLKKNERFFEFIDRIKEDVKTRTDFYFKQWEIKFTKKDRIAFRKKIDVIEKRMFEVYNGDMPIIRNTSICRTPARICPFLQNCATNKTDGLVEKEFIHSELEI